MFERCMCFISPWMETLYDVERLYLDIYLYRSTSELKVGECM